MAIAFFDMDLTITRVITNIFLAEGIGKAKEVRQLEQDWLRLGFAEGEYKRHFGKIIQGTTLEQIDAIIPELPVLEGVAETVQQLHERGIRSEIVTIGTGYFAHFICKNYGLDRYAGSDFTLDGNVVTGFKPDYITVQGKGDHVRRRCAEEGIDQSSCIAIGDSFSDRYMFQAVGTSIAINHSDGLEKQVTHAIKPCKDMREILPLIHLERSSPATYQL